jgi:DNA-binding IclR family transcriptional regulator
VEEDERGSPVTSPIRALDRGMRVFLFVYHHPGVGYADVQAATGVPNASLVRILRTLESGRLVTRDAETGRYRRGDALAEPTLDVGTLTRAARPVLEQLAAGTDETVALFVRDGDERVCVDVVESPHALRHVLHAGLRKPIDAGSTAQVFLAFVDGLEPPEDIPAYTPTTVTDRTALATTLTKVRRRGYAVTTDQTFDGVAGFSAPIRDGDGRVLGAVSVTGPSARLPLDAPRALGRLVTDAGQRIAQRYQAEPARAPRRASAR